MAATATAVIRDADSRRTQTPNATLTTLASPAQGGASLAVWRVDMEPGASGPEHAYDTEQVWTVLSGAATIELYGVPTRAAAGDTLVIPAGVPRRIHADPAAGLSALTVAPAPTRVTAPGGPASPSPAVATPDGDKLIPAWVV